MAVFLAIWATSWSTARNRQRIGTYDVNANCTGKIHLAFDNGLTRDIFIVVARKGHELRGVNAEPGFNAISNGVKLDSPL
jgi:hypothetical protein